MEQQELIGNEERVIRDRKAMYALGIIGVVAVCSSLPYGISCARRTAPASIENAAIVGVLITYYCLLAEALLCPLAVLEFSDLPGIRGLLLDLGIGFYYIALFSLFFWGAVHTPEW